MVNWYPVFWANLLNWRKQYRRFFISGLIRPFFYLMIFDLGIGRRIPLTEGDYLHFMVPGLLTLIIVNHSFSDVVAWFTLRKNYFRILDFYLLSPNSVWSFLLGNTLSSVLKSFLGAGLLLLVTSFFAVYLKLSLPFFLTIAALTFIFASLAVIVSLLCKSERDTVTFSTLVITPMTFLCGTFFPLERLPLLLQKIAWCSPVTPGVYALRSLAWGDNCSYWIGALILLWTVATFSLAGYLLAREES